MNRATFLLPLLGLIACDPSAKNAGQVGDSGTDSNTGPEGQTTGAPMDSADSGAMPEEIGSVGSVLGLGTVVVELAPSPNGIVAATLTGALPYDLEVTEYDNDLNELWSLSLGESAINDLAALPDGGYLVGGLTETNTAAAWRLSCCGAIEDAQEYPTMSGGPSAITVAQPHAGGVLLVRDDGSPSVDLLSADLDLIPTSINDAPEFTVIDGAVTADGNVALTVTEGGAAFLVYEVAPDGIGEGNGPGEEFRLIGQGAELTMLTFSNPDGFNVSDYDSGMVMPMAIPNMVTLPQRTFAADRRGHYAVAHAYDVEIVDQVFTEIAELQSDGTLIRRGFLIANDLVSRPTAVAISDDGSTWVATADTPTGTEMLPHMTGLLHRVF